jgi:uncharacterized protein with PhoU and TrkA domain
VINIRNFIASIRHKESELAREMLRFEQWMLDVDEMEAEAKYLEREAARLLARAESLRKKEQGK